MIYKLNYIFLIVALGIFAQCKSTKNQNNIPENASTRLSSKRDSAFIARAIDRLDTANVPDIIIYVNLHFVGTEHGNFYPGNVEDVNHTNGLFYGEKFIGHINSIWRDLQPSKTSLKNYLGNAKIKFELYSEKEKTADKYGGIWFWNSYSELYRHYGSNVLQIIFHDTGGPKTHHLTGFACGLNMCNELSVSGAYDNMATKGNFGWWAFAACASHEFGHITGLCHAFYCGNVCNGIDLDVAKECHTAPCFDDCGGPNSGYCKNWDVGTSNMMGYNANSNALTPCQWKIVMRSLCFSDARYVKKVFRS